MLNTDLASKVSDDKFTTTVDIANIFREKLSEVELIGRLMGWELMLTNNEIKDIIKIIKSLENREILLKGATRKLLVKKEMDFLIF